MASKKLRPSPDLLFQLESTFLANGYRALTMEKLAESCNFSRQALYFYFGSKAEAFRAVMARAASINACRRSRRETDRPLP
jgi:AcrR family transcriptional regulator